MAHFSLFRNEISLLKRIFTTNFLELYVLCLKTKGAIREVENSSFRISILVYTSLYVGSIGQTEHAGVFPVHLGSHTNTTPLSTSTIAHYTSQTLQTRETPALTRPKASGPVRTAVNKQLWLAAAGVGVSAAPLRLPAAPPPLAHVDFPTPASSESAAWRHPATALLFGISSGVVGCSRSKRSRRPRRHRAVAPHHRDVESLVGASSGWSFIVKFDTAPTLITTWFSEIDGSFSDDLFGQCPLSRDENWHGFN